MQYEPSTLIHGSREFRSRYMKAALAIWRKRLSEKLGKRQALPITMTEKTA